MMTAQQIFETAVRGVLKQGSFSADECGICFYQDAKGNRCVIGHLFTGIRAEEIKSWEHTRVHNLPPDLLRTITPVDICQPMVFLHRLQEIHDAAVVEGMDSFVRRARRFAAFFKLDASFIDREFPNL